MLKFDLSSLPANSAIAGATLSLYCYRDSLPMSAPRAGLVLKLLQNWNESKVSWFETGITPGEKWQNEGGYFQDTALCVTEVPLDVTNKWMDYDVTAGVQEDYATPSKNFGYIIVYYSGIDLHDFRSSEYAANPSLRPKLTVTLGKAKVLYGLNPGRNQAVSMSRSGTSFTVTMKTARDYGVDILDIRGKVIQSKRFAGTSYTINGARFPAGVRYARVSGAGSDGLFTIVTCR